MKNRPNRWHTWKSWITLAVPFVLVAGVSATGLSSSDCQPLVDRQAELYDTRIELGDEIGYLQSYLTHLSERLDQAWVYYTEAEQAYDDAVDACDEAQAKIDSINRLACWGPISCIVALIRLSAAQDELASCKHDLDVARQALFDEADQLVETWLTYRATHTSYLAASEQLRRVESEYAGVSSDLEACIYYNEDQPEWPDFPPVF